MQQLGWYSQRAVMKLKHRAVGVSVCLHTDVQSEAQCVARHKDTVCVCVSGRNWDELFLMGLYGMLFIVISVWGLLACWLLERMAWPSAQSSGSSTLPLLPLYSRALLPSLTPFPSLVLTFPLCRESERASVCVSSCPAYLSALWFNRASGSQSAYPFPLIM